jgi:F-type H+-transporting ATPase subunit b
MSIATSNFLIPNATFIVELVSFLIVLAVVAKYALPPLNRALNDRVEKIRAELHAADEAKADAAAADDERRAALERARLQAREILEQANRTAEKVGSDAQARGQSEFERLVSAAEDEVRLARQRALEEASAKLGELVVDVVERIIGREIDAEAHRDLIDEAVAAIGTDSGTTDAAAAAGARP